METFFGMPWPWTPEFWIGMWEATEWMWEVMRFKHGRDLGFLLDGMLGLIILPRLIDPFIRRWK